MPHPVRAQTGSQDNEVVSRVVTTMDEISGASQVRWQAQRSAEAARGIKMLIGDSVNKVQAVRLREVVGVFKLSFASKI